MEYHQLIDSENSFVLFSPNFPSFRTMHSIRRDKVSKVMKRTAQPDIQTGISRTSTPTVNFRSSTCMENLKIFVFFKNFCIIFFQYFAKNLGRFPIFYCVFPFQALLLFGPSLGQKLSIWKIHFILFQVIKKRLFFIEHQVEMATFHLFRFSFLIGIKEIKWKQEMYFFRKKNVLKIVCPIHSLLFFFISLFIYFIF